MKFLKYSGVVVILVLIGLQFMPVERNESESTPDSDFIKIYDPPANVRLTLQNSCYDCHSNNTRYPWYNNIQPVAWYLENHIEDGKEELNFSEFGSYSSRRKRSKLRSMISQVENGEMPLDSYVILHEDAKLSPQEKETFIQWLDSLALEVVN